MLTSLDFVQGDGLMCGSNLQGNLLLGQQPPALQVGIILTLTYVVHACFEQQEMTSFVLPGAINHPGSWMSSFIEDRLFVLGWPCRLYH